MRFASPPGKSYPLTSAAALRSNKIVSIPLLDAISRNRTVDDEMVEMLEGLFEKVTDREAAGR
jgi:hypothetical protein